MNQGLSKLIHHYQLAVKQAVELMMQSGIPKPARPTAWVETDISQHGKLLGGISYFKHGYGCAVNLPSGKVDFDFGDEGQIDGFDIWRLTGFAKGRLSEYGFSTENEVKVAFEDAIKSGSILQSNYILCYVADSA